MFIYPFIENLAFNFVLDSKKHLFEEKTKYLHAVHYGLTLLGDSIMAIQKRYNGDSQGVVNVDRSRADAGAAQIISNGIGKHISAFKIVGADFTNELGVGGAVEAIIRAFQVKGTTLAYQIDTTQISLIAEASGWGVTNPATGAVVAFGLVVE